MQPGALSSMPSGGLSHRPSMLQSGERNDVPRYRKAWSKTSQAPSAEPEERDVLSFLQDEPDDVPRLGKALAGISDMIQPNERDDFKAASALPRPILTALLCSSSPALPTSPTCLSVSPAS